MELVLSAMSAGGLVGAADQYLCLLVLSLAANQKWIELPPELGFVTSWWFIGVAALFWIITIAPAYSSTLAPGVMNTVNTAVNFLSGFVVPLSAGLLSLAAAGVIVNMNPEMQTFLETFQLFSLEGGLGSKELMIAGGGATIAATLTGVKALAKPILSTSTGTIGHLSAPIYATIENIASLLLMGLIYILMNTDPRLLIALLVVVILVTAAILTYAIYQLWRLKKGIGRFFYLIQTQPQAGLSVLAECFVWGSGWLIWQPRRRGAIMLALWAAYIGLWWVFLGLFSIIPILLIFYIPTSIVIFLWIGIFSASKLMQKFNIPAEAFITQTKDLPATSSA